MKKMLFWALLAACLLACATPYQERGLTGGFSNTRFKEDVFQVTFNGNGYTSEERAVDFTMLRSAELTQENGYRYFIIVEADKSSQTETHQTPLTSRTTVDAQKTGDSIHGAATTKISGGQTYTFSRPRRSNTIICFHEKPDVDGFVYDASFVSRSIKSKYGMIE